MKTSIIVIIIINKQIKFKPNFDKIKQFEQLLFSVSDRYCRNDCIKLSLGASPNKQNITKALDSCIRKQEHDIKP